MLSDKIWVAPSILSADFSKMGEEIKMLERCGADVLHSDVMDGTFVPNMSFGMKMIKDIRKHTSLLIDAHLMIINPEKYVTEFAKAGADYITVHYEACKEKLKDTLNLIKKCGVKCGFVINPDTPAEKIKDVVPLADMILIMSVFPGFGGQKFIPDVVPKIKEVSDMIKKSGKDIRLEVDGGITLENVRLVKDAGANVIVAGSTVFNAEDKADVIEKLRNL